MTRDVTQTQPLLCLTCHKDHNLSRNDFKHCNDFADTFNNNYIKFHVWLFFSSKMSRVLRKPVFGVSEQVRHKQGCAITEDG